MKKIYFLTFTYVFLSLFVNAQSTYYRMLKEDTTTWQHFGWMPGVQPKFNTAATGPVVGISAYAAIDTVSYNGFLYKKFYALNNGPNGPLTYGNKSLVGYLREDTIAKRVYYNANLSPGDLLLYDFSLNVNDSVLLTFPNYSGFNGYYRIDSIVTKTEVCGPRKHFYYRKHANSAWWGQVWFDNIESIGSAYHVAYIFTSTNFNNSFPVQFSNGCWNHWDVGLSCKHDDQTKRYKHCSSYNYTSNWYLNQADSCAYYFVSGGLKGNDLNNLIKIGPNPGNSQIEVSISESFAEIKCSVTDMAGKVVINFQKTSLNTEKNSFIISSRDLAPGVYIVQVDLNGTLIKRPVIIQH